MGDVTVGAPGAATVYVGGQRYDFEGPGGFDTDKLESNAKKGKAGTVHNGSDTYLEVEVEGQGRFGLAAGQSVDLETREVTGGAVPEFSGVEGPPAEEAEAEES